MVLAAPDGVGGAVRILTIAGIPLSVHPSWLLIYALLTWTLAVGYFPRAVPDLPTSAYWANGLVAALLLFVSVLLHELSHSLMAHAHGLPCEASRCTSSAASRTSRTSHRPRVPSF